MNIIGLDLGTTTLSAVVLDGATGAVLETLNVPNRGMLAARAPFERIQDADIITRQALSMIDSLRRKYAISAIGIDGQMHGILYVDSDGRALSPLFTWQDQRGEEPLGDSTFAGELSRLTGCHMATGFGLTTHFWHVRNDCVPDGAATVCTIYDYVAMQLTGRKAPLMHISSAASLGLVDLSTGSWDQDALRQAGIDGKFLPEVTCAFALAGRDGAGVPVSCGIGDNQASFIGAMREMAGGLLVNMGTGGQVSMLTSASKASGDLEVRPLGNHRSIIVGSALCGGRSYALLEAFLRSCVRLAGGDDAPLYEAMNPLGMAMLEDPASMSVDTRFNGTRAMPGLRGSITNIGTENFDAGHLIAGTLMGMAREMHGLYEAMLNSGSAPAVRLVGSGNAIRRNPALRRAFEMVFGTDMSIPAHNEEAAYGAALFGMTAAGLTPSLEDAQKLIRYQ